MSFMHMDSTTSAANIPIVVNLEETFCSISSVGVAEATINARTIGDVTCRRNGITNHVYNRIEPTNQAPGSPL